MSATRTRIRLLRTLRLLARPATAQIAHLRQLDAGESIDELRLQYDEAMAAETAADPSTVSPQQAIALAALTAHLQAMARESGRHLWNERALRHAAEWAHVRELAASALDEFEAWPRRWGKARRRMVRKANTSERSGTP